MTKSYSITVNLPNEQEHTFYNGVQYDSNGLDADVAYFARLFPNHTSLMVIVTNHVKVKEP